MQGSTLPQLWHILQKAKIKKKRKSLISRSVFPQPFLSKRRTHAYTFSTFVRTFPHHLLSSADF